jgi:hypothetical protein
MSADVYATVAEAIRRSREFQAGAAFGVPADAYVECAAGMARAAVDALAGMGDVTDEQIVEAIRDVEWDWEHSAPDERAPHVAAAVRALIAEARATDQARIAELEGRIGAAHGSRAGELIGLRLRAEAAESRIAELEAEVRESDAEVAGLMDRLESEWERADALRATVERVQALCADAEAQPPTEVMPVNGLSKLIHAALADPRERDLGVWTQEQVDSINERAARREAALAPLIDDGDSALADPKEDA